MNKKYFSLVEKDNEIICDKFVSKIFVTEEDLFENSKNNPILKSDIFSYPFKDYLLSETIFCCLLNRYIIPMC